ncbi:MAG: NADH-quinone oxidoreductase subunit A [Candidatus Melainabacteria bacterium]|nr:NADH-quinone oxidoreductase subunit A [Candidatus Melainabacteria bacterium]
MVIGQIGLISALALVNGLILLGLSYVVQNFFGIANPGGVKNESYECGMKPEMEAVVQFDIKYYLFAILFIVFDVEFVFLMPWASLFNASSAGHRTFIIVEAFVFVAILMIGLIYAWKKGALDWYEESL